MRTPHVAPERLHRLRRELASEDAPVELQLGLTGSEPVALMRARGKEALFRVIISPFLLSRRVPGWVDKTLTAYIKALYEKVLGRGRGDITTGQRLRELYTREISYHERVVFLSEVVNSKSAVESRAAEPVALRQVWLKLRSEYFPERLDLDSYQVVWSMRKQTRSLATCNVHSRKVAVAHAMNREEYAPYLEALVYHELCHAVLGVPEIRNGRRVLHGPEFKRLELRHAGIRELDTWINSGGWQRAVRRESYRRRKHRA